MLLRISNSLEISYNRSQFPESWSRLPTEFRGRLLRWTLTFSSELAYFLLPWEARWGEDWDETRTNCGFKYAAGENEFETVADRKTSESFTSPAREEFLPLARWEIASWIGQWMSTRSPLLLSVRFSRWNFYILYIYIYINLYTLNTY